MKVILCNEEKSGAFQDFLEEIDDVEIMIESILSNEQ